MTSGIFAFTKKQVPNGYMYLLLLIKRGGLLVVGSGICQPDLMGLYTVIEASTQKEGVGELYTVIETVIVY